MAGLPRLSSEPALGDSCVTQCHKHEITVVNEASLFVVREHFYTSDTLTLD